jgi:hypothetical protein
MALLDAFNALISIHSKPAVLKRPGTPELYSPCRVCPSNFFRYIQGPQEIVVHGREFIIPKTSMIGQWSQKVGFSAIPTSGAFKLVYGIAQTSELSFNATASNVQTALRAIAGLEAVTVTGNTTLGFSVVFIGVSNPTTLSSVDGTIPLDATITVTGLSNVPWEIPLKRNDRIIHPIYNVLTIDEIIEMVDLGGDIMGYRVRTD